MTRTGRFSPEVRERAVRMVHAEQHGRSGPQSARSPRRSGARRRRCAAGSGKPKEGPLDSLLQQIRVREERAAQIRADLATSPDPKRVVPIDRAKLRTDIKERLTDWRGMMRKNPPGGAAAPCQPSWE